MIKKLFINFLIAGLVLLLSGTAFAANKNDIKVFKLENGHTVVIKEVHTNPIVTIDTWIKTGSVNENDKNNGVAHFLEHLFFKGTCNHKRGEFEKILESKGASFNAATSKDFTHYYITIASPYAEEALDLHADMLLNIAIPKDELNRERKVVIEEIKRSEDNPGRTLFNNLNQSLFKSHPYHYQTLGTEEIIANIPRQSIFEFYKKWYMPANMTTVIVGDVDTQKMLDLVKKEFKQTCPLTPAQQAALHPVYKKEPYINKQITKLEKGDYNGGRMIIGFKGVDIKNQKENYALDLAADILGSGRTSRLYQNIKDKKHLATSIGSGHYSLKDDSIFYVSADFEPQNYTALKNAIFEQLQTLRNGQISDEELKRAKTGYQRSFIYSNESVQNIANSIGHDMTIGGSLEYYTDYIDEINKITKQDIVEAVNKYVKDDRAAISVLLPEDAKIPVSNVQPKNGTEKTVLPNGLTLITDKNQSNDIISASIFVKAGSLAENKPGISSLVASTLTKGTKTKSLLEISKQLEDSGIIISPSANPDYFEISFKSTKDDFDKGFGLLYDILQNPAFENKYIEKAKHDSLQAIKQGRDNPSSQVFEEFTTAMFEGHPYGYTGKVLEKTLPTISRGDVVEFYEKHFAPQNMIVAVSGNIDRADVQRKFASLAPNKKAKITNYKKRNIPELKSNKLAAVKKDTSQVNLVIGWHVDSIMNEHDYASLKVINAILGGGMSSRLFSNLREKRGLAYQVTSMYPSRIDGSTFALYIGTKPENLALSKQLMLKEIEDIKNIKVSQKELDEAKQMLIGQFALSKETNGAKAHYLGWFETIGKGYKFNKTWPDLINSVTADDIMITAKKYFSKPYLISVIGPEKQIAQIEKEFVSESKR